MHPLLIVVNCGEMATFLFFVEVLGPARLLVSPTVMIVQNQTPLNWLLTLFRLLDAGGCGVELSGLRLPILIFKLFPLPAPPNTSRTMPLLSLQTPRKVEVILGSLYVINCLTPSHRKPALALLFQFWLLLHFIAFSLARPFR